MKKIILLYAMFFTVIGVFAQGNGMQGITDATSMVTSYFDPAV